MHLKKHGLSVGIERVGSDFFMSIRAVGKLTHEDYQHITPMLEAAISQVKTPKVKVLFDITEFEGWELRAAWDDFKLGLSHGSDFEKIAIYGNKSWQELASKVGSWFIKGEAKSFENLESALEWLSKK